MSRTTGTVGPAPGIPNPRSGRVTDGKLVLWTDKGEPRVVKPLRIEGKKLFVDAETMLSLGSRAELELPPLNDEEVRARARVEVVYSNPGKGSSTLSRGMLLAFPDMEPGLLDRLRGMLENAPKTGTVAESTEKPKVSKDDDTVYSKVPVVESPASRPTPEASRRAEAIRLDATRRPSRVKSYLWVLFVALVPLLGYLGYLGYEDYLERRDPSGSPVVDPESYVVKKQPAIPPAEKATSDPRYDAYVVPARDAAAALRTGEAPVLEAKLASAERALAGVMPEPSSLRGLRAGRAALQLRDTAMDNIVQVRSLEGVAWGAGSSTPYRTKASFLKAQEARITMIKLRSVDLADAILAILGGPKPAEGERDGALEARIDQLSRMLEVSQ